MSMDAERTWRIGTVTHGQVQCDAEAAGARVERIAVQEELYPTAPDHGSEQVRCPPMSDL